MNEVLHGARVFLALGWSRAASICSKAAVGGLGEVFPLPEGGGSELRVHG